QAPPREPAREGEGEEGAEQRRRDQRPLPGEAEDPGGQRRRGDEEKTRQPAATRTGIFDERVHYVPSVRMATGKTRWPRRSSAPGRAPGRRGRSPRAGPPAPGRRV